MRIYYAGVRFTEETNQKLSAFRTTFNLRAHRKPAMGFHSTFAYSHKPFYLDLCCIPQFPIGFVGDKLDLFLASLVLTYKSEFLTNLHKTVIQAGATWDHPDYTPHITIAKDFKDLDLHGKSIYSNHQKIPVNVLEIFYSEWEQS